MENIVLQIIYLCGGRKNITNVMNCMTRLRLDIIDQTLIDITKLEAIDGVLKVIMGKQTQIVMKPGLAEKYATKINELFAQTATEDEHIPLESAKNNLDKEQIPREINTNNTQWQDVKKETQTKYNLNASGFLRRIANIFVPLIPALIAAGLIGGIANIIQNYYTASHITTMPSYYYVLRLVNNAFMMYFIIFVGINAAKEFGATPVLGGMIGGISLMPGTDDAIRAMLHVQNNMGGVFGVLFACYVLSVVERSVNKIIPNSLKVLLTPTISMLIMVIIMLFAIIPVDNVLSQAILHATNWILMQSPLLAGFLLSSTFLFLVMLGLHQGLMPIYFQQLQTLGYSSLFPIMAMAGAGQVGAAIAVYLRYKDERMRNTIKAALPIGIMGVGEPLIYGVTLPLGRPFITSCIGAGFGGMYIAYKHVSVLAIGPSGIALIPLVNNQFMQYIIGLLISYLGGFLVTYFFGFGAQIDDKPKKN